MICHRISFAKETNLKPYMKNVRFFLFVSAIVFAACTTKKEEVKAEEKKMKEPKKLSLFMDVHNLEPGKVTAEGVAEAHAKDLTVQLKHDVQFLKYWVDEAKGKVYCLVSALDSASISESHKEAHGLIPNLVRPVTDGPEATTLTHSPMFFDIHHLGAGHVTAAAVADAHIKDLAVQDKYKVNFINYWVDEKQGIVMCLAEAPDLAAMVRTHKEAHGLVPDEVHAVKQGN
jgi:hypothetical protein